MSEYETILADAVRLSVADRIQLIDALWETVPVGGLPAISNEWLLEIDARSKEFDSGNAATIPWTQIKTSALERLRTKEA